MKVNNFDANTQVFKTIKIALFPTIDQYNVLMQYIYASNYIYDMAIDWYDDKYLAYLRDEIDTKFLSKFDADRILGEFRKTDPIISNIPLHTCRRALFRASDAYSRYLSQISNHPIKHLPDNMTMSFDTEEFSVSDGYARMQGFMNNSNKKFRNGEIKCQNIDSLNIDKFYKVSIFLDNFNNFYAYASYIAEKSQLDFQKSRAIGIDIGYRLDGSNTIVCSNGQIFGKPDTRHLEERVKFFQSLMDQDTKNRKEKAFAQNIDINSIRLSRRELENIDRYKKAHRKLYNVMDNFYFQSAASIIKMNPEAIILEGNFAGELKRRSKYNLINYGIVAGGKIKNCILNKAKEFNIPVYIADKNFPSTYICSNCGRINQKDLKQKIIFKCDFCAYEINRDLNASINLSNLYNFKDYPLNYNNWVKEIII